MGMLTVMEHGSVCCVTADKAGAEMFYDYAKVHVKAGDGGNGIVAWRREKYVPTVSYTHLTLPTIHSM